MPKHSIDRILPEFVVVGAADGHFLDLQEQSVQRKFCNPRAEISEHNTDYTALIYMNERARLYWLPAFLDYAQFHAQQSSHHLDVLLFRLSDPAFSRPLRRLATDEETGRVLRFLDWLGECGGADTSNDKLLLSTARRLWQ